MLLPIILLLVGLALVVAEVFFVSMGMLGLLAGGAILAADILAFQYSQTAGWILVASEVVLVPLLVWGAFRVLPKLPFGRRMVLQEPATRPAAGFPSLEDLVNRTGRALTDLTPSGSAEFDGRRLSVVAVGRAIPRGSTVVAVSVEGTEVKVRATEVPPPPLFP